MKMLICSIGSKNSDVTLHYAAEIAKALAADVSMLGVVEKKSRLDQLTSAMTQVAQDLTHCNVPARVRVEVGDAESILLAEIEGTTYDLVAVGALGAKRARRAFIESVANRITERAEGSVLLIKGNRQNVSRVLICSSGTEHGRLSVWTGAAVACAIGAEATLLHVLSAMPAMYTGLERMEETLTEFLQADTDVSNELKWAAQVIKAECKIAELKVRRGIVADEILREGQKGDYDLIVLGSSRSPGGLVRMLMGDLAAQIVSRAERPVLVVRPKD